MKAAGDRHRGVSSLVDRMRRALAETPQPTRPLDDPWNPIAVKIEGNRLEAHVGVRYARVSRVFRGMASTGAVGLLLFLPLTFSNLIPKPAPLFGAVYLVFMLLLSVGFVGVFLMPVVTGTATIDRARRRIELPGRSLSCAEVAALSLTANSIRFRLSAVTLQGEQHCLFRNLGSASGPQLIQILRGMSAYGRLRPRTDADACLGTSTVPRRHTHRFGYWGTLCAAVLLLVPFSICLWNEVGIVPSAVAWPLLVFAAVRPWGLIRAIVVRSIPWPVARALGVIAVPLRPMYGASLFAALALAGRKERDPAAIAWVEGRLRVMRHLAADGLLARALLAEVRGQHALALRLADELTRWTAAFSSAAAGALACEWVCLELAERGEWSRIPLLARGATSATTRLLLEVSRQVADPGRAAWRLWVAWLLAPAHRKTLRVVHSALSPMPTDRIDRSSRDEARATPLHARAVALHVQALAQPLAQSWATIAALARHWQACLNDPALATHFGERALTLGVRDPLALRTEFERAVRKDLAELLAKLPDDDPVSMALPSPVSPPLLEDALHEARSKALTELELRCSRLERRHQEKREYAPVDEWVEWAELASHYRSVTRLGDDAHRVAFESIHHPACAWACWLQNDREERAIAHYVFRFLFEEAIAVGSEDLVKLYSDNVLASAPTWHVLH